MNTKVTNLETKVVDLRDQLDAASQYNKRDNLKIVGVPYNKDEDLDKIVKDVMRQNDVELKDEDISIKHRLHTSNTEGGKPPAIILRTQDMRKEQKSLITGKSLSIRIDMIEKKFLILTL